MKNWGIAIIVAMMAACMVGACPQDLEGCGYYDAEGHYVEYSGYYEDGEYILTCGWTDACGVWHPAEYDPALDYGYYDECGNYHAYGNQGGCQTNHQSNCQTNYQETCQSYYQEYECECDYQQDYEYECGYQEVTSYNPCDYDGEYVQPFKLVYGEADIWNCDSTYIEDTYADCADEETEWWEADCQWEGSQSQCGYYDWGYDYHNVQYQNIWVEVDVNAQVINVFSGDIILISAPCTTGRPTGTCYSSYFGTNGCVNVGQEFYQELCYLVPSDGCEVCMH